MDYPKSVPNIGLVDGKFVDEDTATGRVGSLVPASWGNGVTQEILGVIEAAGVAPAEGDNTQLQAAIGKLFQSGKNLYAVDTGSANTYACNYSPAITALTDGMVVKFKAKTANTGASTFSPNGLPARAIVGGAHSALQGGEIGALSEIWLQYHASISGGSWVMVAGSGGAAQVPKATKSGQAANFSQIGSLNNLLGVSVNTTLTSAHIGSVVVVAAAGTTQTLPAIATVGAPGSSISFMSWAGCTIKANASEQISGITGSTSNTIALGAGDQVQLVSNGTSWYVAAYAKSAAGAAVGQARNLKISLVSAASSFAITADEVTVKNALGGQAWTLANINKPLSSGTSGPGAMDVGVAQPNGFVAGYLIYNPDLPLSTTNPTTLGVNMTSAVAPEVYGGNNMPPGYTASALVTIWKVTSGGAFDVADQEGRTVTFLSKQVLSTTTQQASYTPFSIAAVVPPNAKNCRGSISTTNNTAGANVYGSVASRASGVGAFSPSANPINAANGGIGIPFPDVALPVAQTLYHTASTSAGTMTLTVYINSYTF